jgi:hypothetical protein
MNLEILAPFCSAIKFGLFGAHVQATPANSKAEHFGVRTSTQKLMPGMQWDRGRDPFNAQKVQFGYTALVRKKCMKEKGRKPHAFFESKLFEFGGQSFNVPFPVKQHLC